MITSRQNPRIKEYMQLARKPDVGRALVEGVHLLCEALESGVEIESVLLVPRRLDSEVELAVNTARARGVEIVEMSEDCFKKFSLLKSSERVAIVFRQKLFAATELFTPGKRLVILDRVQDPGNAGAIVRIAEATGMDGCVFIGGASVLNGKFLRASMGAAFRVPCINLEYSVFKDILGENSVRLLVTELERTARSFAEVDYTLGATETLGICFGSEGGGISSEVLALATERIFIPMAGKVESLNVAVAAGIVLYHSFSKLHN